MSFDTLLVANRGEIAVRVIATARRMGLTTVAVYSDADRAAAHVDAADTAVRIGGPAPAESYLRPEAILEAAAATGAGAIHPGYGFLSENAAFARAVEDAGIAFVGPAPEHLDLFGAKHTARAAAEAAGVPLLTGTGLLDGVDHALAEAERIGYPVMLKATGGGGGIGMRPAGNAAELREAWDGVKRLAEAGFGDAGLFLERLVRRARHVEAQVFGDGLGGVAVLGDRDCTLQRRNQKVVEEAPAPNVPDALRERYQDAARRLCASVAYRSAGTVEFLYDTDRDEVAFLEVNTRLQVEHPVTEAVYGVDLVEWMLRLAAGDASPMRLPLNASGHAVQTRLYAEDPAQGHRPSTGTVTHLALPRRARVDTWIEAGTEIGPHYDPMIAKLISHGPTRAEAVAAAADALGELRIAGVETNQGQLAAALADPRFTAAVHTTATLADVPDPRPRIDVVAAGTQTTVQDWPGRVGYWQVGLPPSGPMDDLSFRLGNRALGNPEGVPGLECAAQGPVLRFSHATTVCVTGAPARVTVDGDEAPQWEPIAVPAGAALAVGAPETTGMRTYLLVRGGLDVPGYLGSAATFTLGEIGGLTGSALRVGDVLRPAGAGPDGTASGSAGRPTGKRANAGGEFDRPAETAGATTRHFDRPTESTETATPYFDQWTEIPGPVPEADRPVFTNDWELPVVEGPHAAPDFFTREDMDDFYSARWEVHFNSARTGVRLTGPKPRWARPDGGEAGLHPSNIHDNAYAIGAVDFTGDMPVLLGPDGPSLGGFVCPATVIAAHRWRLGQLRPGDTVRFTPVADAGVPAARQRPAVAPPSGRAPVVDGGVLARHAAGTDRPEVAYRRSGDDNILVEYGPNLLDLALRMRVHALAEAVADRVGHGLLDLTPGVRSLQVHFDPARLDQSALIDQLTAIEFALPPTADLAVPSREVWLPLSWDDPATREAIDRYMNGVRDDAPWCPWNIEFIRRVNGLDDVEAVRRTVFDAEYMVLGLGDVYLGAPVATPLDPRHRLVTTKYNPARTWTPQNAVGIGGAYLCVYGMEGPGGYQFVGRTVQVWNTHRQRGPFTEGKPWLLRFFDRIRWYPVDTNELGELRAEMAAGRFTPRTADGEFRYSDYRRFLDANAEGIAEFRARQAEAFGAERAAWEAAGEFDREQGEAPAAVVEAIEAPPGGAVAAAPLAAAVWKVEVRPGEEVAAGQVLVVLEAMKMETPVTAPQAGRVLKVLTEPGAQVGAGAPLVLLEGV
ncbi:biotin carboxylase N-terminal domain-containing protein [Glycomyces harbinensis]|uniref:Urea carboxylase n=1 Tax=Glycomyces harbinensis TaxID=58114 RepID=A0A1G7BB95_9ACTN|nr:biotin carboxylase N-terminal domain-containing protein [Glycomyces harbinensis]SDE24293.1 urea carboxylase [Glycomyces harbinensis]